MKIKKFTAIHMQDAIRQIKQELGPHAVILSTSNVINGKGVFGIFNRPLIEVTAAIDEKTVKKPVNRPALLTYPASKKTVPPFTPSVPDELNDLKKMIHSLSKKIDGIIPNDDSAEHCKLNGVKDSCLAMMCSGGKFQDTKIHKNLIKLYKQLTRSGMNESLVCQIVMTVNSKISSGQMSDYVVLKRYVAHLLESLLKKGKLIKKDDRFKKHIAFVGPTGGGKTTTLAKLAAQYTLKEKMSVGLITMDTFRIGAVEQLKMYAKIIGVPVKVVLSKDELQVSLNEYSRQDIVLIDTAGKSHTNKKQMDELSSFIDGDMDIKKHLVISSATDTETTQEVIKSFSPLCPDSLLFTKIDEGSCFGNIVNASLRFDLPLSYITTGQNVPDDIEMATSKRIVNLFLN